MDLSTCQLASLWKKFVKKTVDQVNLYLGVNKFIYSTRTKVWQATCLQDAHAGRDGLKGTGLEAARMYSTPLKTK